MARSYSKQASHNLMDFPATDILVDFDTSSLPITTSSPSSFTSARTLLDDPVPSFIATTPLVGDSVAMAGKSPFDDLSDIQISTAQDTDISCLINVPATTAVAATLVDNAQVNDSKTRPIAADNSGSKEESLAVTSSCSSLDDDVSFATKTDVVVVVPSSPATNPIIQSQSNQRLGLVGPVARMTQIQSSGAGDSDSGRPQDAAGTSLISQQNDPLSALMEKNVKALGGLGGGGGGKKKLQEEAASVVVVKKEKAPESSEENPVLGDSVGISSDTKKARGVRLAVNFPLAAKSTSGEKEN